MQEGNAMANKLIEPNDYRRKPVVYSVIHRMKIINTGFMIEKSSRAQLKIAVIPA
jgi:hypothetical protein